MAWEPPTTRTTLGRELVKAYDVHHPHRLLDLSSLGARVDDAPPPALDLAPSARRLRGAAGRELLAQPRGARRDATSSSSSCEYEFPRQAAGIREAASTGRRTSCKLMSASLALAGLGACTRQPEERIVPYVQAARGDRPRASRSSSPPRCRSAASASASSSRATWAGRPRSRATPRTGEPRRDRRARAGARSSASTIPTARRSSRSAGEIRTWDAFVAAVRPGARGAAARSGGAGLRILTETVTSPTLGARSCSALLRELPGGALASSGTPLGRDDARAGARLAFGERRRARATASTRPTSSSRSTPTSSAAARRACATRATSCARRRRRRRSAGR